MKIVNYENFSHISDPNTEEILLPLSFIQSTNSDEFCYSKLVLGTAIENCLNKEQKELIEAFYSEGKTKTQIAKDIGVVHSTVVKKMKIAENILKDRVEFALKIYKKQKTDNYLS